MSDSKTKSIVSAVLKEYPDAKYALNWKNPFELLVATILAAQCTDERVNRVTPHLFAAFPTPQKMANASLEEIEELIQKITFSSVKAKAIYEVANLLIENHDGKVPKEIETLVTFPRVGRKTANVVLNMAYNIPSGIMVDTHVLRVAKRLGLTTSTDPEEVENDLMASIPQEQWIGFGAALILHGRHTCTSKNPDCEHCSLEKLCPKIGVDTMPEESNKKKTTRKKESNTPSLFESSEPSKTSDKTYPAPALPESWMKILKEEFQQDYFQKLQAFLEEERKTQQIFPPETDVFHAFDVTPYEKVRVFLLGQDPYHDVGQAHGLCFSVKPGVEQPPSLKNMFKELKTDLGCRIPNHGFLDGWAKQGILMLNAVLTVRAHQANSHKEKGWEQFTDAVIEKVNEKTEPVVFVLWGGYARKKAKKIDADRHVIIESAHPSPLSAASGFFGSKPFSKINEALKKHGYPPINWQLEDL